MLHQWWCSCLFILLLMGSSHSVALANGKLNSSRKWHRKNISLPYLSIFVDQSGHGNFSTVQSAIDSVTSSNQHWVCIYIKAGIYREKVKIPSDKPYIIFKGEGKTRTHIVWNDHNSIEQSPTFMSLADNIIAKEINFVNSYNSPRNRNPMMPAVAAMIYGDKSAFYGCGFAGVQDTLWDEKGRHYFKDCSIKGTVDFIFGAGQSIYEGCSIELLGNGFITAQARANPNDGGGFVFKRCNVFGRGSSYLGRPWRAHARVLFYRSSFSNVLDPRGWNAWNYVGHENSVTFAEYGNYGPGASTSRRVGWEKQLGPQILNQLTSLSFIDSENWIHQQPS